ncbi:DUF7577 domain-containing protein [Natronobiforma cellulositropha]|uniref:DUF7577 domain-containing protein n=1 Tax=Natronobiforma cellulositropha TaxID=1679076 RepID=UPI0021D596AF|nr:hypothetical protein [Natronobiforma cellulositropha]
MEPWGWLVGYILLFALIHLVLYYVYVHRGEDGPGAPSFVDGEHTGTHYATNPDAAFGPHDSGETDPNAEFDVTIEGDPVHCPRCGAANESDPTFTYCWNCINTLRR